MGQERGRQAQQRCATRWFPLAFHLRLGEGSGLDWIGLGDVRAGRNNLTLGFGLDVVRGEEGCVSGFWVFCGVFIGGCAGGGGGFCRFLSGGSSGVV